MRNSFAAMTAAALIVTSCGGAEDATADSTSSSVATATLASTAAPSITVSPPTASETTSATTGDPLAPFLVDTTIEWENCDLLDRGDGLFIAACGFRTHPFFENWLVQINYQLDDAGNKTAVSGNLRGYGGSCEWDPPEGASYEAELVAGSATYEGVMLGTGNCAGLRWSYTQTWNDDTQTLTTSGPIERVD